MKLFDIMSSKSYTDKQGNEKKIWINMGTLFYNEKEGKMSMKLNSIPTSWDGSAVIFPKKEREKE